MKWHARGAPGHFAANQLADTSRTLLVNSRTVEFGRLADVPVTSPTYLVNLLFELELFQTVHMVFTPAELTTRSVSSDLRRI